MAMNPPPPPTSSVVPHPYSPHAPLTNGSVSDYQQAQAAAATATAALSQGQTPTLNAAQGRKRRVSGVPGSRGVANLTPEQLAKKRANDREAQRAIRERTRNTIESLEKRIQELESQQPFQDLQRIIAERDRALAECEQLKRRLGAVAGIVGAGHPSLNGEFTLDQLIDPAAFTENDLELAALTAQQSPLPSLAQQSPTYAQTQPSAYDAQSQLIHTELPSPHSATHTTPSTQASTPVPMYSAGEVGMRKWSPNEHHSAAQHYPSPNGVQYEQTGHSPASQIQHQTNGERLGLSFLLDSSQQQTNHTPNTPGAPSYHPPRIHEQPLYARVPNNGPASCPLDALLNDFHASRRRMLHDGSSSLEVVGPEEPCFTALMNMNSDTSPRPHCHPVSAVLIDIISKFPDIGAVPEQVAVLYVMFHIMRWLICPCQRCYERLPDWCKPVREQLEISHAVWSDYLPWPYMRQRVCAASEEVKFEDFFVPYTTTLSLNWSLPHDCIFLSPKAGDAGAPQDLAMSPAFEAHLRDLNNWSLGTKFRKSFPDLVDGSVRIKDV